MATTLSPADRAKRAAALAALEYIEDGMTLGLGTGSTAAFLVEGLGRRVGEGLKVRCVATSSGTAAQATRLSIPLLGLDEAGPL
ncbi:MAG: ribose 5-phosphate isomerase A, partial [Pseudomonadota bacterium]